MRMRRFVRFWWLGIAIVAFMGPAAGVAASPSPQDLVVDQTPNPGVYGNILWGISAIRANDVWAVGVKATETSNDTLAIHWNGTSWTAVPTPNPDGECQDGDIMWSGQELSGVSGVSPTDVWAVGGGCYGIDPLIEHWDGGAWSIVASPPLGVDGGGAWGSLSDVEAISSSNVWAVGYASSNAIEPLVEHWGGSNWTQVSSAPGVGEGYLDSLSATGPNDVWAVGGSGSNSNLIEHWNGSSWSVVPSPQPARGSSLDSVAAISPTNAWAVGSTRASTGAEVTFVLHWDGQTWSQVPSPNPSTASSATNQLRSVAAISANDVWAVGMYENEQTSIHQHRTLVLHWDGVQWDIVASPQPGHTSQLTAAAAIRTTPTPTPGTTSPGTRLFAAGVFSQYDRNIYDGHYTLPETLVMHR
jgi:hypothetical protein